LAKQQSALIVAGIAEQLVDYTAESAVSATNLVNARVAEAMTATKRPEWTASN
jgi:hypothetical protein